MKNRIFYPMLAMLIAANLFVFCTKENGPTPTKDQGLTVVPFVDFDPTAPNEAADRISCCVIVNSPNCQLSVCGTQENANTCNSPIGPPILTGTEGPSNYIDFCVNASAQFIVRNANSTACTFWVGNTPVSLTPYTLPAFSSQVFRSYNDQNCAIAAGPIF